jgi:nitroreductase
MPLREAMQTQRAIRRLKRDPVDDEVILRCIDMALKAPTGGNAQNWQWIVVRDPQVKAGLARLYRQAWRVYGGLGRIRVRGNERMTRVVDAVQWQVDHFEEVPVLVVPCLRGALPRFLSLTPVGASSHFGSIYPAIQKLPPGLSGGGTGSRSDHTSCVVDHSGSEGAGAPLGRSALRRHPGGMATREVRTDQPQACREGCPLRPLGEQEDRTIEEDPNEEVAPSLVGDEPDRGAAPPLPRRTPPAGGLQPVFGRPRPPSPPARLSAGPASRATPTTGRAMSG